MEVVAAGNTFDMQCKVICIGHSGVGKTMLARRFTTGDFRGPQYGATIGISLLKRAVSIDGRTVEMQVWDTAGQERYQALSPIYYRGSHGALICFDVTDPASFEKAQWWRDDLAAKTHGSCSSTKAVLVGCKADVASPEQMQSAADAAAAEDMPYFQTSAKTGEGVDLAFFCVAANLLHATDEGVQVVELTPQRTAGRGWCQC